MKMKITILEDSVIESERLKNGIRKYGQQYDWDIEIDEYESGEEYFSKNSEGTTIQASAFFLDIQMGQMNGIEVALCSNSPSSRGKNFGKHLPVSNTYPFSCKPFPFCFKKAMRDHGLKANQIAILGDQMYTDILGGNIWGLYTILTAPIAIKDRNITKVFRFFEELIYGYLEKKKLLKRGDFDD